MRAAVADLDRNVRTVYVSISTSKQFLYLGPYWCIWIFQLFLFFKHDFAPFLLIFWGHELLGNRVEWLSAAVNKSVLKADATEAKRPLGLAVCARCCAERLM